MKKIILIVLTALLFCGCQMYKTTDVVIENKSNETAIVNVKNFKEGTKQILNQNITIPVGSNIVLPFYDNGTVRLESIGRNFLQKQSDTKYEILNSSPVPFTVYNMTSKLIKVSDKNNLFDSINIASNGNNNINVFNPSKVQVVAITVPEGILLQVQVQENKLIIK